MFQDRPVAGRWPFDFFFRGESIFWVFNFVHFSGSFRVFTGFAQGFVDFIRFC